MTSVIIIIFLFWMRILSSTLSYRVGCLPQGRQPNLVLQEVTRPLVKKSPSASYPSMGKRVLERIFSGGMPFLTKQFGLGKRHWNLETSSAVVEFPSPYRTSSRQIFSTIIKKCRLPEKWNTHTELSTGHFSWTRPDPRLLTKSLTRPDPRPDPSPICIVFNLIIIY